MIGKQGHFRPALRNCAINDWRHTRILGRKASCFVQTAPAFAANAYVGVW